MKLKVNDIFYYYDAIYRVLDTKFHGDRMCNNVECLGSANGLELSNGPLIAANLNTERTISEKFYLISRDIAPSKVIEPHKLI